MNKLPDDRIYFAQNREDIILEAFFPDVEKGFYVDVGACHPNDVSVTKRFYLKGWSGVNIEPQTNLFGLFQRDRPRDINLNVGIGDKPGSLTLRSYTYNQGLSSVVDEVKGHHESNEDRSEEYEDIEIPIRTLRDIFSELKLKTVHFLKVDVEGYEYEVLAGNDWNLHRPQVICLEANHVVRDWRPILKKAGYELVYNDGLNEYFADSKTDRARKFNYVGHVITRLKGGLAYSDFEKIQSMQQSIEEQNERIAAQARELEGFKRLSKRLLKLAPAKVRGKIFPGKTKGKR